MKVKELRDKLNSFTDEEVDGAEVFFVADYCAFDSDLVSLKNVEFIRFDANNKNKNYLAISFDEDLMDHTSSWESV